MSTPGSDELASELRGLVDRSGLRPAEVARRIGVSDNTMSRYLGKASLKVVAPPAAVRKIVAAVEATDTEEGRQAITLAEDLRSGSASRVVVLRSGTVTRQRKFDELEQAAQHIATFGGLIVPGLLQIEPYARAVFTSAGQPAAVVEDNLRVRLGERAARLASPDHRFVQVMSEAALRWHIGSPEVMAEQVQHIADLARRDSGGRVRIGVIPWTTPADLFPMTNFDLYDEERAVIVGTDFGTAFLDRSRDVQVYVRQFQRLCELAVFDEAAVAEFERIAEDYRQG